MQINLNSPYANDQLKAQIALTQVIDPELGINIIDLGLVYEVDFSILGEIHLYMTFSTPHCPLGEAIQSNVNAVMERTFPGRKILIEIVWEPEWNYDMITEAGRELLGL